MSLRRSASVALQRLPQGLQFVPVAPAKLLPCQGGLPVKAHCNTR
ncbi:hypothetical protein [Acidovorax radicis]|nr:hypothetical protein [Acidovorax radicis]